MRRETGGVRKRGRVWWIHYRVDGERYFESAQTGDERAARSLLAQRRREIREGTWLPPAERAAAVEEPEDEEPEETVRQFFDRWIERRREAGVVDVDDEERSIRRWLLPLVGEQPIGDVRRADIRQAIVGVRRTKGKRAGEPYAPRTVLKFYAAMRIMFADAVADEVIAATPCTLKKRRGELPERRDADPRWRAQAVYTRDEVETIISDPRTPEDRRVYYALALLGGMRAGEVAGRRWRDLDTTAKPLGRMLVASQAHSRKGERETKTKAVKEVPVVPALAEILERWRRHGYALWFGRHPAPEDLIVPSRRGGRNPRSEGMCGSLKKDLKRLGLRSDGRSRHAMRSTLLTLLEVDGANMGIVRRATHAAPSDAFGGYLRPPWSAVCTEFAKLQIELKTTAEVIPLRRASGDSGGDSPSEHPQKSPEKRGSQRISYSLSRR